LLEEKGVPHAFRDYLKEPLSEEELRGLLKKLGLGAREVLRTSDKAYKELGLKDEDRQEVLVCHMASRPGLLQRPIAIKGRKAIMARPPERVLDL